MEVRTALPEDFGEIQRIYAYAREFMRQSGNPNQWRTDKPDPELIREDLRIGRSFLITEAGRSCGVFALLPGPDPTYSVITEGAWPDNRPYGVIHRIAGDGTARGILDTALEFSFQRFDTLRIDTHRDNRVMQHLLNRFGFQRCGIIFLEDGDPRIAYQKNRE